MGFGQGSTHLYEDAHSACFIQGHHATVTTHRALGSLLDANAQERDAIFHSLGVAREHLLRLCPGATIQVTWQETSPSDPPSPLHITLTATSPGITATATSAIAPPHQRGLVRGEDDPLLAHLASCFPRAASLDVAVAFVLDRGVARIRSYFEDLLRRNGRLRLLTGDYFGATEPDGLEALLDLTGNRELRVFQAGTGSFHPKAYVFHFADGDGIAFVGSSNLSKVALEDGVEWNYRVFRSRDGDGFDSVVEGFRRLFAHPQSVPLTHEWIARYRNSRQADSPRRVGLQPEFEPPPEPHEIQRRALAALDETRQQGNVAGLVVLATGLGKTWLSAFDSRAFRRVLFVAHREEILDQALRTYRRIRPEADLGMFTGTAKTSSADVVFASVQTLGKRRHHGGFAPDHFDYIVIDEFHHAAATTYRKLIEHFTPRFLLGLTATPERSDGADLLGLCGNNLVFRCDLAEGVGRGLLCPFAYHGVPDDIEYAQIPWRSGRFDEEALTKEVATQRRAQNALEQHNRLGGRRTLAFCVSRRHADFMAEYFSSHGKRAVAVHTGDTSAPRANSLEALLRGDLDVVFCVDIFNEGVDVPDIDTVMMLRPTGSRVLWLQQLGRGLRKAEGKDRLRVIDYIGNHRSFLDKPRALLGSLFGAGEDYESLRAALQRLRAGDVELPPGCSVTYELEAMEILDRLLQRRRPEEVLTAAYIEFRERHDRRPTAAEMHGTGALSRATLQQSSSAWFQFVDQQGDLGKEAKAILSEQRDFLLEIERTPMQRSYKMLVLLALLELDQLPGESQVGVIAKRCERIAQRYPLLREELATTLAEGQDLTAMIKSNALRAWAGTKKNRGSHFFALNGDTFRTTLDVPTQQRATFVELVQELVAWRLAAHLDSIQGASFECRVTHNRNHPILMLPDRARFPLLPQGDTVVVAEAERFVASFAKIALNTMQREGGDSQANALPELLRFWFGDDAGRPGNDTRVRFVAMEDGYEMTPVVARAPEAVVQGPDKSELDAHFCVETLGQRAAVIYRSRGGAKGSEDERNSDYTPGLDTLLERAKSLKLVLADALLDTVKSKQLSLQERRLNLEGAQLPLPLEAITDTATVRRWIAKAQREHGGNETRQLRLVFESADKKPLLALDLARHLAGNA